MNKKIMISGYYGFDNSGDDAILKVLTQQIKNRDVHADITTLSNNVEQTKREYKVDAINRYDFFKIIKKMKTCDLFISGGGSLLQDFTSNRSLYYYLFLLILAKRYCKKTIVLANGIGPIGGKFNRKITKKILENVDYITLRDEKSYSLLKEIGLKNSKVEVTFDPVILMETLPDKEIEKIYAEENISLSKKYIGIAVRDWKNSHSIVDEVSKLCKHILETTECDILFIPMHYPDDLRFSEKILVNLPAERVAVVKKEYSVEKVMGIISKLEYIISMRYHSIVYAAINNIPMTAIIYDPKIEGIMDAFELEELCSMTQLKNGKLINIFNEGWNKKESTKIRLADKKEMLLKNAKRNIDIILNIK